MAEPSLVESLTEAGRTAVERGLVVASGGNLSARAPGAEHFVVTRAGAWLDRLKPEDFVTVDLRGRVLGSGGQPSSEWKLHQRTYVERPDVNAVVHLHPQYTVLLDALGIPLRLISMDHATYVRSVGRVGLFPNGSDELADGAAEASRSHECVVMAFHGCSTMGVDAAMALRRALNLEQAAEATYRCHLLGNHDLRFPADDPALAAHS